MYVLSKLNKQNEQTWVNMQKRLNEVQFPYDRHFSSDVRNFVKNKGLSLVVVKVININVEAWKMTELNHWKKSTV